MSHTSGMALSKKLAAQLIHEEFGIAAETLKWEGRGSFAHVFSHKGKAYKVTTDPVALDCAQFYRGSNLRFFPKVHDIVMVGQAHWMLKRNRDGKPPRSTTCSIIVTNLLEKNSDDFLVGNNLDMAWLKPLMAQRFYTAGSTASQAEDAKTQLEALLNLLRCARKRGEPLDDTALIEMAAVRGLPHFYTTPGYSYTRAIKGYLRQDSKGRARCAWFIREWLQVLEYLCGCFDAETIGLDHGVFNTMTKPGSAALVANDYFYPKQLLCAGAKIRYFERI